MPAAADPTHVGRGDRPFAALVVWDDEVVATGVNKSRVGDQCFFVSHRATSSFSASVTFMAPTSRTAFITPQGCPSSIMNP